MGKVIHTNNWDKFWKLSSSEVKLDQISWSKRRMICILNKYISKDASILDAGCGSGFFSHYFYCMGLDVTAIDMSKVALQKTYDLCSNNIKIQNLNLLSLDMPITLNRKYDYIFSDGLLEHFSKKKQLLILSNFKKILSPNGKIFTFVPNMFSAWQILRPYFMPGILEDPFTLNRLKKLHAMAGLKIVNSGGLNVIPLPISPEFLGKYLGMLLYTVTTCEE